MERPGSRFLRSLALGRNDKGRGSVETTRGSLGRYDRGEVRLVVLGLGHRHIFFKEILPNAMTPVVTLFPFTLIGGIGSLTSLDFLGFGLQPPTPSWGELMSQGLNNLYAPWISVSTVAALFITLLLTTFVGEGVRDAMDPKSGDRYV